MVRTRSFLIAAVALCLGAGACKKSKEEKAGADKTTGTVGDNPVTKGAPAGGAIAVADDLSLLPADSEVVMGLNFAQLRQSALWKQFAPKLMDKAAGELAEFKAACGFDPMEAVQTVTVGMKGAGTSTPDGAVVIHGVDKGKATACMPKVKEEAAKKGTEITVDGDVFTVKNKDGQTTAWTFVSGDTLLGVMGPTVSKDTVLAAAKGGSGLKTSATFVEMFSKINTKDSVWALVNGNAPFMTKLAQLGKPKAIFGSINVTDGLSVDLRIRMPTADEAKNLVTMIQSQTGSPQVKQMVDKVEVTQDSADARIVVAMSNQKLQQLMGLFGGAMGGMMGGGGMGGP